MVRISRERVCPNGHRYLKSSDCPVCPICERMRAPNEGFLAALSAPARRALQTEGITTLKRLAAWSEQQLLSLHGLGPASIPPLKAALRKAGLGLRDPKGGPTRGSPKEGR